MGERRAVGGLRKANKKPLVIANNQRDTPLELCSPEESLKRARMQIHAAMPAIIGAIVEQAKGGSCQHAKFLMEFAIEDPEQERAKTVVDPDEESLASILLRELRESEAETQVAG